MLMALLAAGIDQVTAWSAVGTTLNNLGLAGGVAAHYGDLNDPAKWVAMPVDVIGPTGVFALI